MTLTAAIVVLTDLTDHSDAALARGLRLAHEQRCKLYALHVSEPLPEPHFSAVEPLLQNKFSELKTSLAAEAAPLGVACECERRSGNVVAEALRYTQEHRARLLIVGKDAYRQSARRHLPINSLVHKLARHGERPLLVCKRGDASYRHAVAMVDLSPQSAAGLFAAQQVVPATASLSVLYCAEPPMLPAANEFLPALPIDYAPTREATLRDGQERLRAFVEQHAAGQRGVSQHVDVGMALDRGLRFIERHECDLVAVGSHGRSALAAIWLGSVSEGLLDLAPCDVLIAPPAKAA